MPCTCDNTNQGEFIRWVEVLFFQSTSLCFSYSAQGSKDLIFLQLVIKEDPRYSIVIIWTTLMLLISSPMFLLNKEPNLLKLIKWLVVVLNILNIWNKFWLSILLSLQKIKHLSSMSRWLMGGASLQIFNASYKSYYLDMCKNSRKNFDV